MRQPMFAPFLARFTGRSAAPPGRPHPARYGLRLLALFVSSVFATALLSVASCSMGGPGSPSAGPGMSGDAGGGGDGPTSGLLPDGGVGPLPFAPDPPSVYVAKVKNVLVGLPPLDSEITAVEKDPNQLGPLVDGWMKLPQYATKMQRFFELAFQQTQVAGLDFENMLNAGQLQVGSGPWGNTMVQHLQESFARTMVALTANGQSFQQAMTTQTYMLTTALKVFYALTDAWQLDDKGGLTDTFQKTGINVYVTAATIPLSETLDPNSANYMHWTVPGLKCPTDPIMFSARANLLYDVLTGVFPGATFPGCTGTPSSVLLPTDFSDWTMVTITQPTGGAKVTNFYDLQALRGTTQTQMVLNRPYVGFFTTPAFFANWQTNMSNQMRVTINQTFIVSTGAQVDGTDTTAPTSTPGLDSTHAGNAACVTCHQLLDPSRSILAATFSWNYGTQTDPAFANQPGLFAFEGVQANVKSVYELGSTLSTHRLMAYGWVEKLCYYVDSEACVPTDPDYQALVTLFQNGGYSWNQLVKALVTSPITTHAQTGLTATTNGETVAVSRRDHLCAAWNARLGFNDICGLDTTQKPIVSSGALNIVSGLPSDGYGRGSVAPVLPNQPTLFFRGGTENLCETIAALVIDNAKPPAGATTWSSTKVDGQGHPTAITDFVNIIMGLEPSDPRASAAQALLASHYDAAKQVSGMTATAALQSTFTAACMAPSAVSMGM
jgi:hypothetical protein